MLDQFEEYFLYRSREPVPGRFADQLARCVNRTDLRANFLISIREDAYAGLCDLFKGRIANVYSNFLHIDYLDRASAAQAIRGPLAVYNAQRDVTDQVTIKDELVDTVLDEVLVLDPTAGPRDGAAAANGHGARVSTPLLQLVMEQIWDTERAEGSHELGPSALHKLRGVRTIADTLLTNALDSLPGGERRIAVEMFDHLVTPSGGKIAESVPDLAAWTGHSEDAVGDVLAKLDHAWIVRPVPAAREHDDPIRFRRYEIFHDVLAAPINRAIAARKERRRTRKIRRFAALAIALLIAMAGVAITFAILANNANNATQAANNEKLTAESRLVAAEAYQNVAQNPELSAGLAMQAIGLQDSPQAENALRAALPGVQEIHAFQDGAGVSSVAVDPKNPDEVASADFNGHARIWDIRTGQHPVSMSLGGFQTTGTANTVAFNEAGTEVAVGYGGGDIAVFDAHTGKNLRLTSDGSAGIVRIEFVGNTNEIAIASQQNAALWLPREGAKCCDILMKTPVSTIAVNPSRPQQFAVSTDAGAVLLDTSGSTKPLPLTTQIADDAEFSPGGSEIVIAGVNGEVDIYDLASHQVTTLSAGGVGANTAAFSPDGKRVVVSYLDGTARVWTSAPRSP
jgi:hypothetical protein